MHFKSHVDAAEVLEVHVHVVRHVGVGGLLSVGVVPADHESSKPFMKHLPANFKNYRRNLD